MTEFYGSWSDGRPDGDGEGLEMEETVVETITTTTTRKMVPSKSSSTKTTTMTTPAKLYGRELSAYDEVDVDELLSKLSQEELTMLAKEVDPDDNFLPPSQRNNYACEKDPTGPLNRKKLIEHINKQALETPDRPEVKPYVPGVIRGKKWIPPPPPEKVRDAEEQITIDLGDEYEQALTSATQEEIIDLAAILGFHSMMNQDQYHASLLNKGQPVGLGWDGITKATKPKVYPMDPPNDTDPEETIKRVQENDPKLTDLNWNNIKNISDEKFEKLFEGLKSNTHLEVLCLVNVGLTDRTAQLLADALRANSTLRVVNVETNFISPPGVVQLVAALLTTTSVEEFRASNQRSQVLGNKIEMEITSLVEQNPTLLRLGLHLEYSDARHRVASHLQRNIDRNCRMQKRARASLSLRLPRSRPSGAGVDADLLVTPPSVEEKTPTREPAKTVITETVHGSIVVEAKSPDTDISSGLQEDNFPSADSNNPDPATERPNAAASVQVL
ncbi:PREDICTED: tropomodulin-1 isoform X2 [Papilio xuthus]|uniref:Tropomodulin-1 isoform X2 n=2 Tax=Papilio xuthus TaxID=66420 RepID=A0AAJ6Z3M5_PAPXU|nr:PREDICTED: tropomodulin-1 isoform X2 [Papilio xuthus]XP_013164668.1 PREDICTED: tropomodulin-1 isoform X2 [Papilio xuthus]